MANNIFQYGHVYAWAREHGRKSVSMRFAYKYPFFHITHTRYHKFIVYFLAKYAAKLHLMPTVEYTSFKDDYSEEEAVINSHKNVLVKGWHVRYPELYLKYLDEIRELFAFDRVIHKVVDKKLAPYQQSIKLGVHIRRGDYKTFFNGRYFYTDEQYLHAINEFIRLQKEKDSSKRIDVFICGNDPKLNKKFYKEALGENVHFPNGTGEEDMYLFSQCDYLIGAPSSYTLIASMYKDSTKLYWIKDSQKKLSETDFEPFKVLFTQFDSCFCAEK
jgi:hypothetical protein